MTRRLQNLSAKTQPVGKSPRKGISTRSKIIAAFVLVTMLIATSAILAQIGKPKPASNENRTELVYRAAPAPTATNVSSGEMSPQDLTSPSLWNKEYIHGPGGRVIATEERVVFTDVTPATDFYDDIYRIAARGVTLGCSSSPPQFCPELSVTRDQMAAFIIRALGDYSPPTPQSQRFNDVSPPPSGNAFYNFIDEMAVRQITLGCSLSPPLYCPSNPVLHQEMAAFIMRARGEFNPPTPATQRFNDVLPSNPFYKFIERMGALDIWQGQGCAQGPGYYCPQAQVTRKQMAHMLVRAFGI